MTFFGSSMWKSSTWNTSYFKQASGLLQTSWPWLSDLKFKGEKDTSGWMRRKRRWIASSFWLHRPSQRLHRPSSWLDWQWLHRPCQRLQLAGLAMAASAKEMAASAKDMAASAKDTAASAMKFDFLIKWLEKATFLNQSLIHVSCAHGCSYFWTSFEKG